jgi:dephospho-CoA kinase
MLKAGLTGGLASGKSFVGEALAGYGCMVVEADQLGHQALGADGAGHDTAIAEFGAEIVGGDGSIDRQRLAALVFHHPARLARLNALIHPTVIRRQEELAAEFALQEPDGIFVFEAAILIETGSYRRFDRLILVGCDEEQQVERAMHREGAVESVVRARLANQMPIGEKRKFADYVIDTSGTKEDTLRQTEEVYAALRSIRL